MPLAENASRRLGQSWMFRREGIASHGENHTVTRRHKRSRPISPPTYLKAVGGREKGRESHKVRAESRVPTKWRRSDRQSACARVDSCCSVRLRPDTHCAPVLDSTPYTQPPWPDYAPHCDTHTAALCSTTQRRSVKPWTHTTTQVQEQKLTGMGEFQRNF